MTVLSCSSTGKTGVDNSRGSHPMHSFIDIYQNRLNHLSAVRAGECPMHPSCSEYSRQAIDSHGFVLGWIMTVDRLIRCGRDETAVGTRIFVNGAWKTDDPVKENAFWQH